MTEPMIMRVARAMWSKANEHPIRRRVGVSFENDPLRAWWIEEARTAIEAMRQPTDAMENAAFANMDRNGYAIGNPASDYTAMIDAALKD